MVTQQLFNRFLIYLHSLTLGDFLKFLNHCVKQLPLSTSIQFLCTRQRGLLLSLIKLAELGGTVFFSAVLIRLSPYFPIYSLLAHSLQFWSGILLYWFSQTNNTICSTNPISFCSLKTLPSFKGPVTNTDNSSLLLSFRFLTCSSLLLVKVAGA